MFANRDQRVTENPAAATHKVGAWEGRDRGSPGGPRTVERWERAERRTTAPARLFGQCKVVER
ncbi:hypothetical protein RHCRD62_20583 [Rhodococcus sp. RD6.2]|nr:hypothetical protein RHCRD62_20583 [Rhodococcus sp. RD6.2]